MRFLQEVELSYAGAHDLGSCFLKFETNAEKIVKSLLNYLHYTICSSNVETPINSH